MANQEPFACLGGVIYAAQKREKAGDLSTLLALKCCYWSIEENCRVRQLRETKGFRENVAECIPRRIIKDDNGKRTGTMVPMVQ